MNGGIILKNSKWDYYLDALALCFSGLLGITGVFFIIFSEDMVKKSPVYITINETVPLGFTAFGLAFLLAAVALFVALLIDNNTQYIFFVFGGLLGALLMTVYAAASFDSSTQQVLPWRYLYFSGYFISLVLMGVLAWKAKRKQKEDS